jgi:hypothetical protein
LSETDRAIIAIILALLWAGPIAFNGFFALGRILDRREDGVSPLPIVGSLCGVIAILLAPFSTLADRLLLLPLGLLPDLIPLIEGRVHAWRQRRGTKYLD